MYILLNNAVGALKMFLSRLVRSLGRSTGVRSAIFCSSKYNGTVVQTTFTS